ncbi:hypothetical protein F4860DRAFT_499961 [Xylaria cubensis]|nr:hypothetical protein F4860DRAFT_499961 [Xylaria cubensis]
MSFLSSAPPLPLESLNLAILSKTTHNITWSPDSELAIGCDDCVLVYVPDFSRSSVPANGGRYDAGPRQYDEAALRFPIAPLKSPDLNRHLFDQAGQEFAGYANFTGAGFGIITGHGSTLNNTVALGWSPCSLGRMNRAVLAVLTAAGILTVYCQGASEAVGASVGRNARSLRPWVPAWHVGAGFLVPTIDGYPPIGKRECIAAFSWARDTHAGVAILSYLNDEHEIVLLLVRAIHQAKAPPGHPGIWTVREVARFMAEGPHPTAADPTDPDYAYCSSSFALSWSPWLKRGSSRTSILSYVAHNHIGFRQVTLDDPEEEHEHELPSIHVARADTSGVCLHLSTDAFVVWEDKIWTVPGTNICRGVIASPMKVQAFELPFDYISPIAKHPTEECGTTYPSEEDMLHMENPITGLIIHPPSYSNSTATPSYTLVRLSATHDNPAWHQTNLALPPIPDPEDDENETDDPANLQWATDISRIIEHQLPRALAHRQGGNGEKSRGGNTGFESDADDDDEESDELEDYSDSDFDSEDDNNSSSKAAFPGIFRGVDTEDQVHLYRVRIWGLTASPGGGTSAVLVSLHSNLELERDTFAGLNCRVLFGTVPRVDLGDYVAPGAELLSTEARAWEWMYGAGPPVPGYSALAVPNRNESSFALRDHFKLIARSMQCVFCDCPLESENNSSWCDNGHFFENCANTGVPIVAPNVSRTCGVCGLKSLKSEELLNLEPHLKDLIEQDVWSQLCGRCGGKFTN